MMADFKKSKLSAAFFAVALMATSAQGGKITSVPTPATGAAGFGGINLENVETVLNGTGSWFIPDTGDYFFSDDSDFTYQGNVDDGLGNVMGLVLAKDWPVGEPSGIKVINDDLAVKAPKATNCIMATSYLDGYYLDSTDPQQVICSSGFQTHKRYKIAMLPTTVDGLDSESVDLVFNVEDEAGTRDYQVFQKINNWTDGRLEGFTVQVGFGIGLSFQTVAESNVALDDLHISVPSDIWSAEQLANFSAGLFGPLDSHTGSIGFFDPETRAGFLIDEYVVGIQPLTDILHATRTLGSDYNEVPAGAAVASQFGPWLPDNMLPYGVFFDDDGNPETDAELLAWYGYNPAISALGWMSGSQHADGAFSEISNEEILTMGENLSYTMGEIDDLVNVGLNYVVTVGDVSTFPGTTFTIRITPTQDTSGAEPPSYVDMEPSPLLLFRSSDAEVLLEPVDKFEVGSLLTARVGDADLNMDPNVAEEVMVEIASDSGLSETLTLLEQGLNRGVFAASLPESFSHVAVGTIVTMSYVDVDNGTATSVTKTSSSVAIEELVPILSDVSILDFLVPDTLLDGRSTKLRFSIVNDKKAEEAATGRILITGSDGSEFTGEFTDLAPGRKMKFSFKWKAVLSDPTVAETVTWTATITINDQIVDDTTAVTQVEVKSKKGKN